MQVLYILIAILVFGFLILIHEFGHYLTARLFGVKVFEFAIGMGPKLLWYESKKTGIVYSLRMLPVGGFVSMLGEDPKADREAHPELFADTDPQSDDPIEGSLGACRPWQKLIVNAAGAFMNLLFGFLLMIAITCASAFSSSGNRLGSTVIADFPNQDDPASSYSQGLRSGDEVLAVNGHRVHIADQLLYDIMREGTEPVVLTVLRDGEKLDLTIQFPKTEQSGQSFGDADFRIYAERDHHFGTIVKHTFYKSVYIVGMVWQSAFDLITGRYSFDAVSGPVGTGQVIADAAKSGLATLANITAVITINLGIFNLFPLPALDGGHIFVNLAEIITRKKIPPKVTAIIDTVGLVLLMGLMLVVTAKDIFRLFS